MDQYENCITYFYVGSKYQISFVFLEVKHANRCTALEQLLHLYYKILYTFQ